MTKPVLNTTMGAIALLAGVAIAPTVTPATPPSSATHEFATAPLAQSVAPSHAPSVSPFRIDGHRFAAAVQRQFVPPSGFPAPRQSSGGASRTSAFVPPADNSTPQQAAGGASRTSPTAAMTALIPETLFGTTLSARPTLLVYLPASNAHEAVFTIKDERQALHYQTTLPVSGDEEIVAIQLPETAPPLAINQNYHWYLALKLDGQLNPSSPFVDAWIQRIEPTAETLEALNRGTALDDASTLARNGVWYDSAAILASLQSQQSANASTVAIWREFLSAVGLGELAYVPLTPED